MACQINRDVNGNIDQVLAPNGEPSKLYDSLLNYVTTNIDKASQDVYVQAAYAADLIKSTTEPKEVALALWSKVYTKEFKDQYQGEYKNEEPIFNDVINQIIPKTNPVVISKINQRQLSNNQVNAELKLVQTLLELAYPKETKRSRKYNEQTKPERLTIRLNTSSRPNLEDNVRKTLSKKGVPSNQIDLMFNYMKENNINKINSEQLAIDIATNYSFTVEINKPNNTIYSRLTVPGGVNYSENEIVTPNITPSIKSHAEFATDQSIGWFRSDNQEIDLTLLEKQGIIKKVPC